MLKKLQTDLIRNSRLSTQGFLLYSPISILGFPVSVLVTNTDANPITTLLAGVILTLATYALYKAQVFVIASIRFIDSHNLLVFILVPLITGALRGGGFYFLVIFLNLEQPSEFSNRILSSAFTTIFWLCLANYVVSISRNFRYQYQNALHFYLLGSKGDSAPVRLSSDNEEVLDNLQRRLSASVEKYLGNDDAATFKSLSGVLTEQINDQIRPLSKRIFIRNLSEFPFVQHKQLLQDALYSLNFSWKWFYFIITTLAIASNASIRSFSESFWRTTSFLLPLALLLVI